MIRRRDYDAAGVGNHVATARAPSTDVLSHPFGYWRWLRDRRYADQTRETCLGNVRRAARFFTVAVGLFVGASLDDLEARWGQLAQHPQSGAARARRVLPQPWTPAR